MWTTAGPVEPLGSSQRMREPSVTRGVVRHAAFDTRVPMLIVKVGQYPRDHGALGVIRSLGRVGVPVHAMTEDAYTPTARSRFLAGRIVAPTTGLEAEAVLVEQLAGIAHDLGRPAVAVATDDEAAILVAEHADVLRPYLITPEVEPSLPRKLANKRTMRELCLAHGVATLDAAYPMSFAEVEEFASRARFPVVVKPHIPWLRLANPDLRAVRVLHDPEELLAAARTWPTDPAVMLQDYIPDEVAEDWIFQGYFDASSTCLVSFTGVKYRSWPPRHGVSTYARVVANSQLASEAAAFCRRVNYRGVVDMDWRFDRRDGRYHLLDCNPRPGAQFRLFETDAGIDVVRALHLDLTGRSVPGGRQIDGRGYIVETRDLAAILSRRRVRRAQPQVPHERGRIEPAWFSLDDPLPFLVMTIRLVGAATHKITHAARTLRARGPFAATD
jgi:predicted ATP-grasp superfamily ATP-dependent carboligase